MLVATADLRLIRRDLTGSGGAVCGLLLPLGHLAELAGPLKRGVDGFGQHRPKRPLLELVDRGGARPARRGDLVPKFGKVLPGVPSERGGTLDRRQDQLLRDAAREAKVDSGVDQRLHEQKDIRRAGARNRGRHVDEVLVVDEHLFAERTEDRVSLSPMGVAGRLRGAPHRDAPSDLGRRVRHGSHGDLVADSVRDRAKRYARDDGQDKRIVADRAAQLAQDDREDLRLDREHDDVRAPRGLDIRAAAADAEAPRELVPPGGARPRGDDRGGLDQPLLQESPDHCLGHRAAADEGDGLRGERHAAKYAELHTHSNYSFLDGASHPEDLVDRAVELGLDAVALTDTNGLYGAVRFWQYAQQRGIHPVLGTELKLVDGDHLVLLARDNAGWTSLCRLISRGQMAGEKEDPRFTLDLVREHAEGVVCLTGCARGVVSRTARAGQRDAVRRHLTRLREIFPGRLYVELEHHLDADDDLLVDALASLADEMRLPVIATNNVHYPRPEGRDLHDVLRCIDAGTTLAEAGHLLKPNGEYYLKSGDEVARLFARRPDAFANATALARACDVDLRFRYQRLPGFAVPQGHTAFSFLYELCHRGMAEKYQPVTAEAARQLARELDVIERTKLAEFFLINWDIVRFCKERGIPAQGRGSAANSIVAYVLDITKVDPIAHDLLFERFLTEDAQTMPDIDLDIATNDREDVIQYVYQKYGEDHSAMVCNVVTYRARSATREVAKALGYSLDDVDRLAKLVDVHEAFDVPEALKGIVGDERWDHFRRLVVEIAGFPRHLSIHNGGMLITAAPLIDTVPIERATMPDRVVCQFDKRDVEDLGLIKMDLLGLRTLSLVKDSRTMIATHHGSLVPDLDRLPLDDAAVYDLLCEVDTIGVFQVESRAQAQALPRVRPRNFADIVVEVAIIRPGPLQGNAVNPFINRRQGREPVTYLHPSLEPILKETLGVVLFQEQILKVAMIIAGFSAAQGDKLRRAMSRARSSADMERLRAPFLEGAARNGVSSAIAEKVFAQIAGFADFGFCKSHAAAFALVAYQTAWLKLYYPAEFFVALLNNQPMGFYSPAVCAGDAKRHGVRILPVDVNRSQMKACVEAGEAGEDRTQGTLARARICRTHHVRLGFTSVDSLGEDVAKAIVAERERGTPFRGFEDFARRVPLKEEALRNLALVGAFDPFGEERRALLWRARDAHRLSPGFARTSLAIPPGEAPPLPPISERDRAALDYRITGIPTGPQAMRFYRDELEKGRVVRSTGLALGRDGAHVRVAGAMVVKQRPGTAKGFVFLSLEDEDGLVNIIVRPNIYAQYKRLIAENDAVVVEGRLQRQDGVISVLAEKITGIELFVKIHSHMWG